MAEPSWKSLPVVRKKSEPAWKSLPKRTPSGALVEKPQEPGWFEPGTLSGAAASKAADALQGFAQGASFGLSDELAGAMAAGVSVPVRLGAMISGTPEQQDELAYKLLGIQPRETGGPGATGSAYKAVRDQMRGVAERAQAESPYTYGAGTLAGGIVGGLATGAPGAAKGTQTIKSRLLELGKYGAKAGAAAGLGMSGGDLTEGEVLPVAGDVASSALIGAASAIPGTAMDVGPARLAVLTGANKIPYIGKALPTRTISRMLEDWGLDRALKSVLPQAGLSNRLRNKLGVASEEEQRDLAKEIVASGFVQPFEKSSTALARAEQALEGSGEQIGDLLARAQTAAEYGVVPAASRDYQQLAVDRAMRKALNTQPRVTAGTPAWQKLTEQIGSDQRSALLGEATYPELWQSKSQLQKGVNYSEMPALGAQMYRKGVQGYTRGIYEQLNEALGPQSYVRLVEEAARYHTAARLEEVLREKVSREAQRAGMGLLDLQKAALLGEAGKFVAPILGATRPYVDPTLSATYLGASKLAKRAVGTLGAPFTSTVAGAAGVQARDNAYRALLERFGISPQSKEELADEAFIRGQTSPDLQPGRQ